MPNGKINYDSLFKKSVIPKVLIKDTYPDARGRIHRGSRVVEVSLPGLYYIN